MASRNIVLFPLLSLGSACGVGMVETTNIADEGGAPSADSDLPVQCGNQVIEGEETCDGGTESCVNIDSDAFTEGEAICKDDCSAWDTSSCVPPPPDVSIEQAIASINADEMKADLEMLSSDKFAGRYPGSQGDKKTLEFITGRFKQYGLEPGNGSSYLQDFTWRDQDTANPIGVLPGNDPELKDEVVLIGAHHDHLGSVNNDGCNKKGGNDICNGADDNGSGTIAVVHAAMALSQLKGKNHRTLVFMTFGAEEKGYVGSCHYVKEDPLFSIDDTVYMINLDMIGHSASGSVSANGGSASPLGKQLIEEVAVKHDVKPKLTSAAGDGSDHVCFVEEGVPAVFFFTGMHDCYHATCDTAEKINFETYTNIARTSAELLWEIAQSDKNPRTNFAADLRLIGHDKKKHGQLLEEFADHKGMPAVEEIDLLP